MKRFAKIAMAAAITLAGALCLTGCNDSKDTITKQPNQGVSAGVSQSIGEYSTVAYYELERPSDVRISFEADKIQKISYKYRVLDSKEYKVKNDVITIKQSVFAGETAGDKRIRIFVDNMYTEITLRVVTKVIYTTEDFKSITNDMNGVYVLGADIDFGGEEFWPIGKALYSSGVDYEGKLVYPDATFEGIFDGMGYSVKNVAINTLDRALGEENGNGPSLGNEVANGRNYNNGLFFKTGGSAQIINTNFINITVKSQGLCGAIVGSNGGLVKNCYVTCNLSANGWMELAGGIAGVNGSGDAAGRIENCLVLYSSTTNDGVQARGIADWNNGVIKNCYAAPVNDYVYHVAYDSETKTIPEDFDYDDFFNSENFNTFGFGYFTIPALPGSSAWGDGPGGKIYYKGGDIVNSDVVRKEFLLDPANFTAENGWDTSIWNFTYGAFPNVKVQSR